MDQFLKEEELAIHKFSRAEALWRQADLAYGTNGAPLSNLSNVAIVLEKYWPGRDRIRISQTNDPVLLIQDASDEWRQWTDIDEIKLVRWLQEEFFLYRVTKPLVSQAILCIAKSDDK